MPLYHRHILATALAAVGSTNAVGPCDIYAKGNTPCVAAHSTTRALYSAYSGPLYQIIRGSDGATSNISPLSVGGVANAESQDSFCTGTTCLIKTIFDQSGHGNHLNQAPPGGFNGPEANGFDNLASAVGAPVTVGGHKAYGVFVSPGTGYSNNAANGTAVGDSAQGIYAVLDGTHYNGQCCFDYGNAEVSSRDTGNGHMEAIYYGDCTVWGTGAGKGPWVMADLENGLFSGSNPGNNPKDPSITDRFITTVVKGQPNNWAIRGGNAVSGSLSTYYNGQRPTVAGYNPMSKEGAIVLGIGGDNSNGAQGTFYEGVMTSGYPSDDTENALQANIVAAKYTVAPLTSGPSFKIGSSISFRATTPGFATRYITHNSSAVNTQVVQSSSAGALKKQATWTVRPGLANSACFSFESIDTPKSYLRHSNFELHLDSADGSKQFNEDATFCPQAGLNGQGNSIRSWNYPTRYFRHFNNILYQASNGGVHGFDSSKSFADDVTWVIGAGFV